MRIEEKRKHGSTKQCSNCGGDVTDSNFRFCPHCGTKLTVPVYESIGPLPAESEAVEYLEIIRRILYNDILRISTDTPINMDTSFDDLGLDSLGEFELISDIEEELGINLPIEITDTRFDTVAELANAISSYRHAYAQQLM